MSNQWWEDRYELGPPQIEDKYFPRPLYPPDAAPSYTPSQNHQDVAAYKRVICRLGRWGDWNPSLWDQAFSNAFSHGRGPNVRDTGVAGVQRQQGIQATGFIGLETFKTLSRAIIPPGREHSGDPAMDATAANQLMNTWAVYKGKAQPPDPPPSSPTQTVRERALEGAIAALGYKESPPNSNNTKYGSWYGMNYQPWCAMFVTHCFEVDAGGSPSFARGAAYSYCPYILSDASNNRGGLSLTTSPIPGDVVLFDWGWDGVPDHVGIFDSGTPSSFTCIEGNTSLDNNSNGGEVMRRTRSVNSAKIHFVRVAEP